MLNVYGQSQAAASLAGLGVGVTRFSNLTIHNVSGTAQSPGKMMCDPSAPCEGIAMSGVRLASANQSYTCSDAFGTASDCSPRPCLEPGAPPRLP